MEISDIASSLRRHWPVAMIILVLIPPVMAIYLLNRDTSRPPARYSTSADVLIPARNVETGETPPNVPPVLLQGQVELALSRTTRDVALQAVGRDPADIAGITFDAKLSPGGSIMTLTVAAPQPESAASILDAYIVSFQDARRQSVLDAAVDLQSIESNVITVLTKKITDVESQILELGLPLPRRVPDGDPVEVPARTSNESTLLLYERNALLNELQRRQVNYSLQATRATVPAAFTTVVQRRSAARITPPPPSPLIPLLQILGVGLLLAVALPVLFDRLDHTITEARAGPTTLRTKLLGTIPFMPRRLHHEYAVPGSVWDGAFRSLAATSISTDRLPSAIMITSPTGSTQDTVAANFAAALAGLGVSVALVGTVPRQEWFLSGYHAADSATPAPRPLEGPADEPAVDADGVVEEPVETVEDPAEEIVETPFDDSVGPTLNFPEALSDAHAGLLTGDIRPRLATIGVANLHVIPPGSGDTDLPLDGLPPLLDALSRSEIDVTVIAGPALLEDPDATIIAWSTRHVLWAVELGRVDARDARLAADRLELAGVAPFGLAIVSRN